MIAPDPVSATIPLGTERQSRANGAVSRPGFAEPEPSDDVFASLRESLAEILPPLPPPPDPPGTAYVAAVLSGALSPRPTSSQEVYLRVGQWKPPDSSLHLADKTI